MQNKNAHTHTHATIRSVQNKWKGGMQFIETNIQSGKEGQKMAFFTRGEVLRHGKESEGEISHTAVWHE